MMLHGLPSKQWMRARQVGIGARIAIALVACAGCTGEFATDTQSPWGGVASSRGVYWTIRCMELCGAGCASDAERVAQTLRNTQGIKPRQVFVKHDLDCSIIYYGKYLRTPEAGTGAFKIPAEMQQDAALIKALSTNEGGRFFYDSRPVPVPTPDPGPPEWRLRNNPATFALRIAIFFDEPGFYKRKEAAVAHCHELRQKGHEAWYRHSEFVSEVFVGGFGPDAREPVRRSGIMTYVNGPEVQRYQLKEQGRFRYELWNMKLRSTDPGGHIDNPRGAETGSGPDRRIVYLSRLFPVSDELDTAEGDFYRY